jgi:hypothetical protein
MKQNEINNNDNIDLENQELIEQVDEYNINQLLMNIFKRLLMKGETKKSENTNDNSSLLSALIEKIKNNYPNFYLTMQEPNENFGLFYTDMSKLTKEFSSSSNFTETDGFSLLGFFEEEIRNFFRTHPFLLKNAYNNDDYNEEENKKLIENKIRDITYLLKENNSLISDIYKEFKNVHSNEKQKYIDYINQKHSKISETMEEIKSYAYNTLNSEQSFKSFDKFKETLLLEQKKKEEEIKFYKALLNKYTSQGEEMTQLANEFKRYSNMIACLKDK